MPPRSPGAAFAFGHPAHFIALGFGSGLSPIGPGTAGTLLAIPFHFGLVAVLPLPWRLLLIAVLFLAGIWACGRTGRDLGVADHGSMNWDEFVAFLFVLTFTPPGLEWCLAALLLFRLFDIVKPPPVSTVDRLVTGGIGVMLDDVAAAGYTLLSIALMMRWFR